MTTEDRRYISRARLIELLGIDAATRVIDVLGNAHIYLPAPNTEKFEPLVRKLGAETARTLCVEFGGTQVMFPQRLVAKRAEILRLRDANLKAGEIAKHLGASENYVYYVLAQEREERE
jgi:hypothetical protein